MESIYTAIDVHTHPKSTRVFARVRLEEALSPQEHLGIMAVYECVRNFCVISATHRIQTSLTGEKTRVFPMMKTKDHSVHLFKCSNSPGVTRAEIALFHVMPMFCGLCSGRNWSSVAVRSETKKIKIRR